MKRITFFIGMLCATYSLSAQDCSPALPINQNFESAAVPAMPDCTVAINGGAGNNWVTVDNPGSGFTSKALHYAASAQPADAWFFTKGIDLEPGIFYKVSYRYGNNSAATTENLVVTLGNAPTIAAAQTLGTHTGITGGVPVVQTIELYSAPGPGTYYFGFHATSGANQGSLYVDDIIIEPVVCGTPTNIGITNITQNGASASWSPPTGSNISVFSVYQYAYATTNTPPAEGSFHGLTSIDLSGLTAGTTYYFFMRSLCGPVWSDWTEGIAFTTPPCDTTTVPYALDFESAITPAFPACTVGEPGQTGNDWATTGNPGSGFTSNTLHYNGNDEAADAWFFTRGLQLTAGTFYKVSYKYGNDSADTTEKLLVTFGSSPSAISATGTFADHDAITGGTLTEANVDFFNVPASGVYYFGFNAYSDASQGSLYVDDFLIEELECGVPSNIQVSDITGTSATITWEAPTTGNSSIVSVYQYAYSEINTPPVEGIFQPNLTADITELTPGTTYYVFLRTQCGPIWSDWIESVAFTTPPCDATTVPYLLDFESAIVPALPDCTVIEPAQTGNDWVTLANPGNGFTSNALHYNGNDEAANAWFFTRGLELTAGTYYKVSYKYGNSSADTTEKLRVAFGDSPGALSVTNTFADHDNVTGATQFENAVDFFNVPVSGVYYFGFNAYSDASQGSLYVDDFLIEEMDCGVPSNIEVSDITATTATVTWEAPTTGNSSIISVYQYAYGTDDTPPAEGTFDPGMTADLSGLEPETTYYVFTRTQCGPIWSDWTVTTFTTGEVLGAPSHAFKSFTAYPNPVKDVLTLSNSTVISNITIYSVTGQLVHSQAVNSQNAAISLSQLAAGAYLVNVTAEGESQRIKIIKE